MSYSRELVIGYLVCRVVGLFAMVILWLIAKGEINLDLLISEKTGEASMSRFQLLIFTLVIGHEFRRLPASRLDGIGRTAQFNECFFHRQFPRRSGSGNGSRHAAG